MGVATIPIRYYAYLLILFDLLTGGPRAAALAVGGAIAGHIWWWLVWGGDLASQGLLSTRARAPEWLRKFMGESGPRVQPQSAGGEGQSLARAGIHVMAPRRPATVGGAVTGYSWGGGRRLGN